MDNSVSYIEVTNLVVSTLALVAAAYAGYIAHLSFVRNFKVHVSEGKFEFRIVNYHGRIVEFGYVYIDESGKLVSYMISSDLDSESGRWNEVRVPKSEYEAYLRSSVANKFRFFAVTRSGEKFYTSRNIFIKARRRFAFTR